MQLLKLNFENPQRLYEILTEKSLEVAKKFGIDNVKTLEELCMYCGWIPPQGDKTLFNQSFLVNVLSSIEYRDIKNEFLYSLYGSLAQTWNEFARFYLDQAKKIFPVVVVQAGKPVYIVLVDGVSMEVPVDELRKNI